VDRFCQAVRPHGTAGLPLDRFCQAVRPHGTAGLPLDRFLRSVVFYFFFQKSVQKFKFHENLARIMVALHEDLCTLAMIPH
jgi:hypothetical protein